MQTHHCFGNPNQHLSQSSQQTSIHWNEIIVKIFQFFSTIQPPKMPIQLSHIYQIKLQNHLFLKIFSTNFLKTWKQLKTKRKTVITHPIIFNISEFYILLIYNHCDLCHWVKRMGPYCMLLFRFSAALKCQKYEWRTENICSSEHWWKIYQTEWTCP